MRRWLGGAVTAAGAILASLVGVPGAVGVRSGVFGGSAAVYGGWPGGLGLGGMRAVEGHLLIDLAFQVININSGKCLTVAENAILVQRACGRDLSYRWRFVPEVAGGSVSFLVVNVSNGKCLTIRADGTAAQFRCDGERARRWLLQRRPGVPLTVTTTDALLENAETRRCLTIAAGSVAENAVVVQGECDSERSRRWTVRLASGPARAASVVTTVPA